MLNEKVGKTGAVIVMDTDLTISFANRVVDMIFTFICAKLSKHY